MTKLRQYFSARDVLKARAELLAQSVEQYDGRSYERRVLALSQAARGQEVFDFELFVLLEHLDEIERVDTINNLPGRASESGGHRFVSLKDLRRLGVNVEPYLDVIMEAHFDDDK